MENSALLIKLKEEKRVDIEFQKRRHSQWNETYNLYRDIVETNELTQRQEVNIPIMKETKKTLLSRIDEPPDVVFDCLEKDIAGRDKEIVINEIWQEDSDECNFEGIDIMEKNNVLLFGRTFKKLNFLEGNFKVEVPNKFDIVVDPKMNPLDIETAGHIEHLHIFRKLRDILANPKYDAAGKLELKKFLQGETDKEGKGQLIQFPKDSTREAIDKKLTDLGVDNFDEFACADIEVELNEHFTLIWDQKKRKFVRHVVLVAAENAILFNKTLKEAIGVEFWPFTTWADDLDNEDVWSDGIGDTVRTPNKVMNIYFSTMLENRVYRNLGMMWYLPAQGYDPQTFEPEPFGQYPAPLISDGRGGFLTVQQVIQQMQIPALEDNLVDIDFLIKLVERATAATAIEKGVSEKGQITLGEVEQLTARAAERIVSMAKFYRRAWKEFAWKWRMIREANASDKTPLKLYKKTYRGSYFEKEVYKKDWYSKAGYKERVMSSSEQEAEQTEGLNKLIVIKNQFPDNPAIQKIARKRMLEILDLTPDEMREIEEQEKVMAMPLPAPSAPAPSPEIAGLGKAVGQVKQLLTQPAR
jgi:hypothetical protein